ncbi:MAG: hypothetical protein RhofKO_29220 [Rhodothermales bacterium]
MANQCNARTLFDVRQQLKERGPHMGETVRRRLAESVEALQLLYDLDLLSDGAKHDSCVRLLGRIDHMAKHPYPSHKHAPNKKEAPA